MYNSSKKEYFDTVIRLKINKDVSIQFKVYFAIEKTIETVYLLIKSVNMET